jgi:negative regulator of flagellin synthesis FlgM
MKIAQQEAVNAAQTSPVQSTGTVGSQPANPGTGQNANADSPAATVSFSPQAQEIAKYKAAVNAAPDVREDLVSSLKSRIENGEYNVSGDEIADMMVRRYAADNSA